MSDEGSARPHAMIRLAIPIGMRFGLGPTLAAWNPVTCAHGITLVHPVAVRMRM
jgi:hypothetical protein